MAGRRRDRAEPTEEWGQLELLLKWPEQREYELIRPIVVFGGSIAERARETGAASESKLRRDADLFDEVGMPRGRLRHKPLYGRLGGQESYLPGTWRAFFNRLRENRTLRVRFVHASPHLHAAPPDIVPSVGSRRGFSSPIGPVLCGNVDAYFGEWTFLRGWVD